MLKEGFHSSRATAFDENDVAGSCQLLEHAGSGGGLLDFMDAAKTCFPRRCGDGGGFFADSDENVGKFSSGGSSSLISFGGIVTKFPHFSENSDAAALAVDLPECMKRGLHGIGVRVVSVVEVKDASPGFLLQSSVCQLCPCESLDR